MASKQVAKKTVQPADPTLEQVLEMYLLGPVFEEAKELAAEAADLRSEVEYLNMMVKRYQSTESETTTRLRRSIADIRNECEIAKKAMTDAHNAEMTATRTKLEGLMYLEAKQNELIERERNCELMEIKLEAADARRADAERWLSILLGTKNINIPEVVRLGSPA